MFEKLSTEDISIAVDDLIGSLGVREETNCLSLLALLEKKDTQRCVQEIATRLGLPILISLSYVPKDFSPTDTGFQSSSLSRTDWTGHGVEGITAQVSIPSSLPLFGSSSLAGYPVSVRVKAIVAAGYVTLLIATPIALVSYFNRAWRRVRTVPNTTVYVIWLSLESIAALGFLVLLAYSAMLFAAARLR